MLYKLLKEYDVWCTSVISSKLGELYNLTLSDKTEKMVYIIRRCIELRQSLFSQMEEYSQRGAIYFQLKEIAETHLNSYMNELQVLPGLE